ncbi:hypothetical protein FHS59_004687 [Algoriphagus iocasae]|uniref:Uncharacterized protein n=1 Tax=Algoriphagus iocasae TaxID=1836499 RepID=A0A841MPT4_9BACT|nr:hypothetical protein [Algoriphagus iocasae]MBB6329023.1 hypothetical protein [Algoriphagus iocasae]
MKISLNRKKSSIRKIVLGSSAATLGISLLLAVNAEAQSSSSCDNWVWGCDSLWQEQLTNIPCTREICWIPGVACDTYCGMTVRCIDGPDFACAGGYSCKV